MREYKPVLISMYDLLGEITKDGNVVDAWTGKIVRRRTNETIHA